MKSITQGRFTMFLTMLKQIANTIDLGRHGVEALRSPTHRVANKFVAIKGMHTLFLQLQTQNISDVE